MQQLGLTDLTVNVHHLPDRVKGLFSASDRLQIPVHFSKEMPTILGTGGALKKARHFLEGAGAFTVGNADIVNGFGARDALEFHRRREPLATLVVMKHPEAGKKYGAVWTNAKGEVLAFGKTSPGGDAQPWHYVGLQFVEESVFKYIPDGPCDIFRDVYMNALAAGEQVLVFEKSGAWFDCGNLEDYLDATEELLGILPRLQHTPFFLSLFRRFWPDFDRRQMVWEGEGCDHYLRLAPDTQVLLGKGCRLHQSVKIKGFAVLGENVVVEKDVSLENVVILNDLKIAAGRQIQNNLIVS
jgi:mannose-1-phosphate guanylyltransferase